MKSIVTRYLFVVLCVMSLAPAYAYAHTGVGQTTGFAHGFHHPLGGLDHILAMVAVGIWAAQTGGRAVWAIPAAFVAVMTFGSGLGLAGVTVPFIEEGIVASVLILVFSSRRRRACLWL